MRKRKSLSRFFFPWVVWCPNFPRNVNLVGPWSPSVASFHFLLFLTGKQENVEEDGKVGPIDKKVRPNFNVIWTWLHITHVMNLITYVISDPLSGIIHNHKWEYHMLYLLNFVNQFSLCFHFYFSNTSNTPTRKQNMRNINERMKFLDFFSSKSHILFRIKQPYIEPIMVGLSW